MTTPQTSRSARRRLIALVAAATGSTAVLAPMLIAHLYALVGVHFPTGAQIAAGTVAAVLVLGGLAVALVMGPPPGQVEALTADDPREAQR